MKVFTCDDHPGYWPVGVASVIVAKDKKSATRRLHTALKRVKLDGDFELTELDITVPSVIILNDGNY